MTTKPTIPVLAGLIAATLAPACMVSPNDGMVVSDRAEPVFFLGATLEPSRDIEIQARRPDGSGFDGIGGFVSASSGYEVFKDADLYVWSGNLAIPEEYWTDGGSCRGYQTTVRAVDAEWGINLPTTDADWGTCLSGKERIGSFAAQCISESSPEVRIVTEDFAPTPPLEILEGPWISFDGGCETARVGYRLPPGDYDRPIVQMRRGSVETLDCEHTPADGKVSCKIEFGAGHLYADGIELFEDRRRVEFRIRARDLVSCGSRKKYTDFAEWSTARHFGYNDVEACEAAVEPDPVPEPDPEDPDAGTWHNLECYCATELGEARARVRACYVAGAPYIETGATITCDQVERDIERTIGVNTECIPTGLSATSTTGCFPGDYRVQSIDEL